MQLPGAAQHACFAAAPGPHCHYPPPQCSLNLDVALAPSPARRRLQNDLQKLIEQHKDVQHAPAAPTLVRLEVRLGWLAGGGAPGTAAVGSGIRRHALCTHGALSRCCCRVVSLATQRAQPRIWAASFPVHTQGALCLLPLLCRCAAHCRTLRRCMQTTLCGTCQRLAPPARRTSRQVSEGCAEGGPADAAGRTGWRGQPAPSAAPGLQAAALSCAALSCAAQFQPPAPQCATSCGWTGRRTRSSCGA